MVSFEETDQEIFHNILHCLDLNNFILIRMTLTSAEM